MVPGDMVQVTVPLRAWGLRRKHGERAPAGYWHATQIQDARTPPGSPAQRNVTNILRKLRRMVPEECFQGGWDYLPHDLCYCSLVEFADHLEDCEQVEAAGVARTLADDVLKIVAAQLGDVQNQ